MFAAAVSADPTVHWLLGDDLCDCTFQRVGEWANPYLGKTLRVRMCCIWAELYKQYPEYVQECGYYDPNRGTYTNTPAEWDSQDAAMPIYLWHRHLAAFEGLSVGEIRHKYAGREAERPKAGERLPSPAPTAEEIAYAHRKERIASGWILEGED